MEVEDLKYLVKTEIKMIKTFPYNARRLLDINKAFTGMELWNKLKEYHSEIDRQTTERIDKKLIKEYCTGMDQSVYAEIDMPEF